MRYLFGFVLFFCVGVTLESTLVRAHQEETTRKKEISELEWLSGAWTGEKNGRLYEEQWMNPRAGLMLGMNRASKNGQASYEFMRIQQSDSGISFFASPSSNPPVEFKTTHFSKHRIVFENPKNDFPQRIIYHRKGDQLHAAIEGEVGGQPKRIEWTWGRPK
ncbi:MAG: DUF6265 family protein [Planctomycetota bacterium]